MKKTWTVKFNSLKPLALVAAGGLATQLASGQCVPPPPGLVAWWPGEGDGSDIAGTNDALALNATDFSTGRVGDAFSLHGGANDYIEVPNITRGQAEGTVEMWFQLNTWKWSRSSAPDGIYLWSATEDLGDWMDLGTHGSYASAGELMFGIETDHWLWAFSGITPALNQWYHVAGTWGASGIRIYVNGALRGTNSYSGAAPTATLHSYIGRSSWPKTIVDGLIDEVSIYDRALTASEVEAIYSAGGVGKCKGPTITNQPQSQLGYWGKSVTFSVGATGASPITYQWLKDNNPIADATNSVLLLSNLQTTNAGTYTVVVINPYGSTPSASATLTVNPAGMSIALYAGVTIDGVVGQTYGIQSTLDLSNTNSWAGRANVTLTNATQLWYDSQPATQPQTYYRVVPGPISIP